MQSYSTEVYLPCNLDEVTYVSKRKKFSIGDYSKRVTLAPISAVPFVRGALLFIGRGAFFVDNFEMLLSIDKENKTLSALILEHPEWSMELEELNAVGGLKLGDGKSELYYSTEAYECKKQYVGKEWANFALAPIVLEVDITNTCNATCVHCSRDSRKLSGFMPYDELMQIFSQCKRFNVPELLVMGGEPLLHPEFPQILRGAKEYDIKAVRTSTNGILITQKLAKFLAEYATHVQVSIHGASAAIHDNVTRNNGSFQKACNAVKLLRAEGVDVAISFTLLDSNETDINEMPPLALRLGANSLRFLALSNVGRGKSFDRISNEKRDIIGARIRQLYSIYKPQGLEIAVGGFPALTPITNEATLYGCAAGRTHFHVAHNKMINPCGSVEGYHICSLQDTDILRAWHDVKLKQVRKASNCKCAYRYICSGACKADTDFAKKTMKGGLYHVG